MGTSIPQKVGRYQMIRELGRGGRSMVYLAHDPFLDRDVAIKTTFDKLDTAAENIEVNHNLFFREAKSAGQLDHPNIVSVYDATLIDNRFYIVMEYVDGSTLRKFCLKKNLLSLDKAALIVFQIAKALDYAHNNGVVHCDIKPSNILISKNGEIKISDFDSATFWESMSGEEHDSLSATVYYASPEQVSRKPLTPSTDVFALGVVLYELVTAKNPFMAENEMATIYNTLNREHEPLSMYRNDVPKTLEDIVNNALAKDSDHRYKSCADLAADLSQAFDHLEPHDLNIDFEEKFISLKNLKFFKKFSSKELSEVVAATLWLKYETGVEIIIEGDVANCFYIIVSGDVAVKKKGKTLAVLKVGDCFGEMAYLGKTKRTATIEAVNNTILMKVSDTVMEKTSKGTQLRFYKVFSNTLITRLTKASDQLTKLR